MGNIKETQYFQAVQDKKVEVSDVTSIQLSDAVTRL